MKKTPWIVSALLVVGIIAAVVNVSSQMQYEKHDTEWIVQAEELAIRAATEEEIPKDAFPNTKHYILTGKIHNNSSRRLMTSIHVNVKPKTGYKGAVTGDLSAMLASVQVRKAVPVGCTGKFELPFAVWPEIMESDELVLVIDPYGKHPIEIATIAMPD